MSLRHRQEQLPAAFPACPYDSGGSCQLQNAPALQEVVHAPSPVNTLLSQEGENGHGNSQSQHLKLLMELSTRQICTALSEEKP